MKSETELIRRIAALTPPELRFGDDMAWIDPAEPGLLWSVDMLMDGVDFDSARHSWRDVGRKALGVNLSDCAAMGVRPLAALAAVSLCDALSLDDALELHRGIIECGAEFACPLVGGDGNTDDGRCGPTVGVAARADHERPAIGRAGARPDDTLWLTGPVGGSILGRHLRFTPRVREALALRPRLAPSAMIDISDGLARDLWRICEASGCGAVLLEQSLAALLHPDARALARQDGQSPREHALYDGEDFELIVVLPAGTAPADAQAAGLLPLGRCIAESGLFLESENGSRSPIEPRGWEHFR